MRICFSEDMATSSCQLVWFPILIMIRSLLFKNITLVFNMIQSHEIGPYPNLIRNAYFWITMSLAMRMKDHNYCHIFWIKKSHKANIFWELTQNKISIFYWEVVVHLLNFNTSQNNRISREFLNVWLINNKLYILWTF